MLDNRNGRSSAPQPQDNQSQSSKGERQPPAHGSPAKDTVHVSLDDHASPLASDNPAAKDSSDRLPDPIPESDPSIWVEYLAKAREADKILAERWDKDLDAMLIFAGLFSAVVTAFIVESRKGLQEDLQLTTNALLTVLIQLSNSTAAETLPTRYTSIFPFEPSASALWTNGLWFASLTSGLSSAGAAMLAKSWISEYNKAQESTTDHGKAAAARQRRFDATLSWHFTLILSCIPLFLHLSFFLFVAGLLVLLWSDNHAVAICVTIIAGVITLLYLSSTILPLRYPDCPFRTPTTAFLQRIVDGVLFGYKRFNAFFKKLGEKWSYGSRIRSRSYGGGFLRKYGNHVAKGLRWLFLTPLLPTIWPLKVLGWIFPEPKTPSDKKAQGNSVAWMLSTAENENTFKSILGRISELKVLQHADPQYSFPVLKRLASTHYLDSITRQQNRLALEFKAGTDDATIKTLFSALSQVLQALSNSESMSFPELGYSLYRLTSLLKFPFCRPSLKDDALELTSHIIRFAGHNKGIKLALHVNPGWYAQLLLDELHNLSPQTVIQTLHATANLPSVFEYTNRSIAANRSIEILLQVLRECELTEDLRHNLFNAILRWVRTQAPPDRANSFEAIRRWIRVQTHPRKALSFNVVHRWMRTRTVPDHIHWRSDGYAVDALAIRVTSQPHLYSHPFAIGVLLILLRDLTRAKTDVALSEKTRLILLYFAIEGFIPYQQDPPTHRAYGQALAQLQSTDPDRAVRYSPPDSVHVEGQILLPELRQLMSPSDSDSSERHNPKIGAASFVNAIRVGLASSPTTFNTSLLHEATGWAMKVQGELETMRLHKDNDIPQSSQLVSTVKEGLSLFVPLTMLVNDLRQLSPQMSDPILPTCLVITPLLDGALQDTLPAVLKALYDVIRFSPAREVDAFIKAGGCAHLASHILPTNTDHIEPILGLIDTVFKAVKFDPDNPEHTQWFQPIWDRFREVKSSWEGHYAFYIWLKGKGLWEKKGEGYPAEVRTAISRYLNQEFQ